MQLFDLAERGISIDVAAAGVTAHQSCIVVGALVLRTEVYLVKHVEVLSVDDVLRIGTFPPNSVLDYGELLYFRSLFLLNLLLLIQTRSHLLTISHQRGLLFFDFLLFFSRYLVLDDFSFANFVLLLRHYSFAFDWLLIQV